MEFVNKDFRESSGVELTFFFVTLLILVATPLVFDQTNFQVFALPKAFVLKFGIGLLALFWIAKEVALPAGFSGERCWHPLVIPLGLFVAIHLLATVTSIDPWMSLVGVYGRFFGLQGLLSCFMAYVMLTSSARTASSHIWIISFCFISAALVGFYAILQFMALDPFNWNTFLFPGNRVYSTTGNSNFCGNLLALVLPFSFFLLGTARSKILKFLVFLGSIFILSGIVFCQTRGAWVAVFCSLSSFIILAKKYLIPEANWKSVKNILSHLAFFSAIFLVVSASIDTLFEKPENFFYPLPLLRLIYVFWPGRPRHANRIFFAYLLLSLLAVLGLYIWGQFYSGIVEKFFMIFDFHESIRIYLWRDFFDWVADHFFLGSGPETYRRSFMPYKSLELALQSHEEHDNPHNNFFSIWAGVGILGPLCYLWIFWAIFKESFQVLKSSPEKREKILALSFVTMIISYFVWSLPAFDTIVNIPTFFALLAAFALWRSSSAPLWAKSFPVLRKAFYLLLLPFFIFSAYTIYQHRLADQFFLQSIYLSQNIEKLVQQKKTEETRPYLREALHFAIKAMTLNPQESYYPYQYSRLLFEQAKQEKDEKLKLEILAQQERALTRAQEHPWAPESILIERMFASILKKSYPQAIADAQAVLKVAPYRIDVRQTLEKMFYSTMYWKTHPESRSLIVENARIILKHQPDYLFSRLFLIDIHLLQNNFEEAMEEVYFIGMYNPKKMAALKKVVNKIESVYRNYKGNKKGGYS